jgi:nitrogen PTS system EIIA component
MQISTLFSPDRILLGLRAANKETLISELARRIARRAGFEAETIAAALSTRELLGSTGVGRGIALPHARVPGLKHFVALFARLEAPIEFEAIDEAPVDLVFLLLNPGESGNEHLAALAAISRLARDDSVASRLRQAKSAQEVSAILKQSEGRTG